MRAPHEFVATARELWDSWTPEGVARPFAHQGRHFDIAGEFGLPRSPQGQPVVIQVGDSDEGREFAAATADVVFTGHGTLDSRPGVLRRCEGAAGDVRAVARGPEDHARCHRRAR